MQRKKEFMNYTVLMDLLLVAPAIYFYQEIGLVVAFLIVLVLHTLFLLYYLNISLQQKGELNA